jgi:hypothetical protein
MNLAVHGLEGDIQQALTYYDDPLNLFKKCDYVIATPPFNVDEVDADKIKNDPRLYPLGCMVLFAHFGGTKGKNSLQSRLRGGESGIRKALFPASDGDADS